LEFNLSSETHGGINPSELKRMGFSPADLIDFSVNSNPFGPSPRVLEAIRTVDITQYPDRECSELTELLAMRNKVALQNVLVGNGTSELIWLVAQAFLNPGDAVLIVGPTFGEYERAAAMIGARVKEIRAQAPDFTPPLDEIIDSIRKNHPRLVFICNPNNPTGKLIVEKDLSKIMEACGTESILVIDEAYKTFIFGQIFYSTGQTNSLVLRSMTKDFALAGLRLGYLLGDSSLIKKIRDFQPTWSVNTIAQVAGLSALSDLDYYDETLSKLRGMQNEFFNALISGGYHLIESSVHYTLINFSEPGKSIRFKLLQNGIQVRDCASFGLSDFIRVSTRLKSDNIKLLKALNNISSNNY